MLSTIFMSLVYKLFFLEYTKIMKGGYMKEINQRIAQLRSDSGLTMRAFAERISITATSVNAIEKGKNNPSEQTIKLICKEFGVSEIWLRKGVEPMYLELSREEEIAAYMGELLTSSDKEKAFQKRFIKVLSKLTLDDWKTIEKIMDEMIKEKD